MFKVYLLKSLKVSDPKGLSSAPEELKLRRKTRRGTAPEGGALPRRDNNYYIGQTDNIEKRLEEHNSGQNKSTQHRRPFVLVGYEEYKTRNEARWREYELKHHSNKKKQFIEKLLSKQDKETPPVRRIIVTRNKILLKN